MMRSQETVEGILAEQPGFRRSDCSRQIDEVVFKAGKRRGRERRRKPAHLETITPRGPPDAAGYAMRALQGSSKQ